MLGIQYFAKVGRTAPARFIVGQLAQEAGNVLPGQQGRLFMMREWLELESDEICKELAITPTNLWVMLHRARLRLRECLQAGWFGAAAAGASS